MATRAAGLRGTDFGDLIATGLIRPAVRSIVAARLAIATVFTSYALSVVFGIVMATSGNADAMAQRDAVVGAARTSAITTANRSGDHVRAALLDFGSNLAAGGGDTLVGVSVIGVYPLVGYRGWVGGIVVLDAAHQSRLGDPAQALYYLVTILLQLIPYSIAGGVGVRLGVAAWKQVRHPTTDTWLGLPLGPMRHAALAYVVIAPLFLIASLFEFLVHV